MGFLVITGLKMCPGWQFFEWIVSADRLGKIGPSLKFDAEWWSRHSGWTTQRWCNSYCDWQWQFARAGATSWLWFQCRVQYFGVVCMKVVVYGVDRSTQKGLDNIPMPLCCLPSKSLYPRSTVQLMATFWLSHAWSGALISSSKVGSWGRSKAVHCKTELLKPHRSIERGAWQHSHSTVPPATINTVNVKKIGYLPAYVEYGISLTYVVLRHFVPGLPHKP